MLVGFWLLLVLLSRAVERAFRPDPLFGVLHLLARVYVRIFHRLRVEGAENIPQSVPSSGLIVIANHVSGLDPVMIQTACRFEIRWMMLREMMLPGLESFWEYLDVIAVGGSGDSQSARTAIKHVKDGQVLGIFPQGAIERPWKTGPIGFQPGVGLIISRTGAPVLICIIDSVPRCESAWGSFFKPSPGRGARLRFLPMIRYQDQQLNAAAIVDDLERRIREAGSTNVSATPEHHPPGHDTERTNER
jgi:1-acyl-sn-glycerol-3-phosphate acyltransferase